MHSTALSPVLAITLTLVAYFIAGKIYARWPAVFLHPLIIAPLLIILALTITNIPIPSYQEAGRGITFLMGPATVAFAVPLYRHWHRIRNNWLSISMGIMVGALSGLISVILVAKALHADHATIVSLAGKSTTMPIAIEITRQLHGNEVVIIFAVVLTGIIGGAFGPEFLRMMRVRSPVATGLAIGVAAHAAGTSRAFLLGEVEGSLSSAALVLSGLVTAIMAPWICRLIY